VADINFEMTNVWGETEDVFAIGAKYSDLDGVCRRAAETTGLRYIPERNGELGFFFRSDQLSFARAGIPGVWVSQGIVSKGPDKDLVQRKFEDYRKTKYHKVTDEVQPDWDLRGTLQIVRWAEETNPFPGAYVLDLPGASRAACHNAALEHFREAYGDWPEVWFTLDDDQVICRHALDRLQDILDADEEIGLVAPWNCCSERDRDVVVKKVGGEDVQFGTDFNVGGAAQAIPRRTLERLGRGYDADWPWLEDYEFTRAVRAEKMEVCIARSVFATILYDDDVDPSYRAECAAAFQRERKAKGL
jgi:hypothetical protein